jgi:hypothetical protein
MERKSVVVRIIEARFMPHNSQERVERRFEPSLSIDAYRAFIVMISFVLFFGLVALMIITSMQWRGRCSVGYIA